MMTRLEYIVVSLMTLLLFSGCSDQRESVSAFPHVHIYYDTSEVDYEEKSFAEVHFNLGHLTYSDMTRIKMRGGWSRQYPKKNYTLNLQADPNVPSLPKDNDWILTASYIDKTMVRHVLSYELFKRLTGEAHSAPNTTYVELYINHDYNGLYLLHPRVDRSFLNLTKEGTLFKDPPIFFKKVLPEPEEAGNPFHQKYPDQERRDDNAHLDGLRNRMMSTDLCAVYRDSFFMNKHVLVNWHLLLLVTHGSDGLLKNFYLYQSSENEPYKICIWDYDHSFGRDGDYELNQDTTVLDVSRNWLLDGLLKCPDYTADLKATYEHHRENGLLEANYLITLADSIYQSNRSQILRNGERWPWSSRYYADDNTSDEEMIILRSFVRNRMLILDNYFELASKGS